MQRPSCPPNTGSHIIIVIFMYNNNTSFCNCQSVLNKPITHITLAEGFLLNSVGLLWPSVVFCTSGLTYVTFSQHSILKRIIDWDRMKILGLQLAQNLILITNITVERCTTL